MNTKPTLRIGSSVSGLIHIAYNGNDGAQCQREGIAVRNPMDIRNATAEDLRAINPKTLCSRCFGPTAGFFIFSLDTKFKRSQPTD